MSTNEEKRLSKASRIAALPSDACFFPLALLISFGLPHALAERRLNMAGLSNDRRRHFCDKLHTLFGRIAGEHLNVSPDLRKLFRGHNADMWFMSGVDQIRAAFRAARDLVGLPVKWNSKGPSFKPA